MPPRSRRAKHARCIAPRFTKLQRALLIATIAACTSDDATTTTATTTSAITARAPLVQSAQLGSLPGSFSVTSDGAATYTISIDVPRGRAGIEPAVALSYSSRGGNGLAGVGWSVGGLSEISRCPLTSFHDRQTRPVELDWGDGFCLDGMRLVTITDSAPGTTECPAMHAELRTEPDTFARIVRCGTDDTGPREWIVYGKDGRIRRYGSTTNSRMETTATVPDINGNASPNTIPRRVAWMLARVEDRVGNYMDFTYGQDVGLDRLEWWPAQIDYTGFGTIAPSRRVVFEYEARPDVIGGYERGIDMRRTKRLTGIKTFAPDPAEQALAYARRYKLGYQASPQTARSLLHDVTQCDPFGACLPATTLTYTAPTPSFTFSDQGAAPSTGITVLYPLDIDGDARDDLYYDSKGDPLHAIPAETLVRHAEGSLANPTFGTPYHPLVAPFPPFVPFAGDVRDRVPHEATGDTAMDFVFSGCSKTEIDPDTQKRRCAARRISLVAADGTGHLTTQTTLPSCATADATCLDTIGAIADIDGDHRPDLLRGADYVLDFAHSSGIKQTLVNPIGRLFTTQNTIRHIDVDGDGAADVLVPYPYNGGTRFDALHLRLGVTEVTPLGADLKRNNCQLMVDVNGDGLVDVVDVESSAAVSLNRGDGRFDAPTNWAPGFLGTPICAQYLYPDAFWVGFHQAAVFPVDYNGDGLQDLLVLQPQSASGEPARVLVSTGHSFQTVSLPSLPLTCASPNAAPDATTLDANGDGLFDVVFVCPDQGLKFQLYTQTPVASRPDLVARQPDLLAEVRNGLGAIVRHVDYKATTDPTVYTRTTTFAQPLEVVASESVDNGSGAPIEVARHLYEGATTTATTAEGWLGFRRHTTIDPRTQARHRATFAMTEQAVGNFLGGRAFHPFSGQIVEEMSWVTVGGVVKASRLTMVPVAVAEQLSTIAPDYWTYIAQTTSETFEVAAASFNPDGPGAPLTQTITSITGITSCGDPTTTVTTRGPGTLDRTTTTRTFTPAQSQGAACDLGPRWIDFLSLEDVKSERGTTSQHRGVAYVAEPDGTGRVRDTIRQPGGAPAELRCTRVFQRDTFGTPTVIDVTPATCNRVTTGALDARTRTAQTRFARIYVNGVPTIEEGIDVEITTNALGHTATQRVVPGLGVVYVSTDVNGQTTARQYDGFGRPVRTDLPDGSGTLPSTIYATTAYLAPGTSGSGLACTGDGFGPGNLALIELVVGSDGTRQITCRDRLGRVRRTGRNRMVGAPMFVDTTYDSDGTGVHALFPERVYQTTRPHTVGAPITVAQRASYDAAGRTVQTCHPTFADTSSVTACSTATYSQLTTETCDERGVRRREVMTPSGDLASSSIFPDGTSCTTGTEARTSFAYGPFGTLIGTTDALGNTVGQKFDDLGRRLAIIDRDIGRVDTTYDAFDELKTSLDSKGQLTTTGYDQLGRVVSRVAPDGADAFAYDPANAKSQLAQSTRGSVTRTAAYDTRGRPLSMSLTVNGTTYTTSLTYDAQSRVATRLLPNAPGLGRLVVRHEYLSGHVSRLELGRAVATCTSSSQCQAGETCLASLGNVCGREIWRAGFPDAEDRLVAEQFGNDATGSNGVSGSRVYTAGYLSSILVSGGPNGAQAPNGWQNEVYTYFDNGDLKSRRDAVRNATETFGYDGADRLASAQVTGRPVQTYRYDALGNVTFASDTGPAPGCEAGSTFVYGTSNSGPHILMNLLCGIYNVPFVHDANGNHITGLDGRDGFTWTSFNKLATHKSASDTWQLVYDANHERVAKTQIAGTNPYLPWTTMVYAGDLERRIAPDHEEDTFTIPVGNAELEATWRWNGQTGSLGLTYLHSDRLASRELAMSAAGALVEARSTTAWGVQRAADLVGPAPWPNASTPSFTGHRYDTFMVIGDGHGFVDMGGRIYSPLLKRFWSPDPVVQAPGHGPSWNRFSYVMNNPLKFTDPSGYLIPNFRPSPLWQLVSEYAAQQSWSDVVEHIYWNSSVTLIGPDGKQVVTLRRNVERAASMLRNEHAMKMIGDALVNPLSFQLHTLGLLGDSAAAAPPSADGMERDASGHPIELARRDVTSNPSTVSDGVSGSGAKPNLWGDLLHLGLLTSPAFIANEAARLRLMGEQMRMASVFNPQMRWIYGGGVLPPIIMAFGVDVEATAVIGTTGGTVGYNVEAFASPHSSGVRGFTIMPKSAAGFSIGLSLNLNIALGVGRMNDWYGRFNSATMGAEFLSTGMFWSPQWIGWQVGAGVGLFKYGGTLTDTDYPMSAGATRR